MAANEDGEVTLGDIEDELTLVALILVDHHIVLAEAGQELTQVAHGEVGHGVDLRVVDGAVLHKVGLDRLEVDGSIEGLLQGLALGVHDFLGVHGISFH